MKLQITSYDMDMDPRKGKDNGLPSTTNKENAPLETAAVPTDDTEDAAAPKKKEEGTGELLQGHRRPSCRTSTCSGKGQGHSS
ncbi:hypothetical protein KUCAC02_011610 [Chaenocephalus aceratus]|uniref:Uncharacterized protein n=1 Tax=Chaenocephalus aceratus TaxID=36190 RepID=A0ACB9WX78_CHAAC|nr:hypothetical protein KUCAC02_011610 [Chaenocephalus aceratus]